MIDLTDQVAIVTGGSRGIGAATAVMFAKAGADVVLMYEKDKKSAQKVLREITSFGVRGCAMQGKLQNEQDCARICRDTFKLFRRIDILVNSGGIWEYGAIGGMSRAEWDRTIAINLTGTFLMCNAVIPYMKKRHFGRIINVASTAGQRGEAFHSHYGASKGGTIAFTKSIAAEVIRDGIWVNCVAPGWVDTEMTASEMKNSKARKKIQNTIPRNIIPPPEEIAGPILFLASSLANNVVGEILNVNGGSVLCG